MEIREKISSAVPCWTSGRAASSSTFTLALVEGLSGAADYNKDQVVYLNELDNYVSDRVKELTQGQQHPVTARPTSVRSFPLARP